MAENFSSGHDTFHDKTISKQHPTRHDHGWSVPQSILAHRLFLPQKPAEKNTNSSLEVLGFQTMNGVSTSSRKSRNTPEALGWTGLSFLSFFFFALPTTPPHKLPPMKDSIQMM
jgi:hypothetical protein